MIAVPPGASVAPVALEVSDAAGDDRGWQGECYCLVAGGAVDGCRVWDVHPGARV